MSITSSEMSPADLAAVCGNDRNNGNDMWGNNGAWWIIILLLFGWGRNGFGGFGNNGGNGCGTESCATPSDVRSAVDQQTLISKLDNQTYGLADSTFALNNNMTVGFNGVQQALCQGFNGINTAILQSSHGVDNAVCTLSYNMQSGFNDIGHQISDCCCNTQAAIKDNTVQGILNTNNIQKQISDCCCDVEKMNMQNRFDAQTYNCNTLQAIDKLGDRIIDYISADKMQTLRDENQALRLAASQSAQNQYLVNTLRPLPIPAYSSCNPWASCGCGYNSGCGC